MKHFTNLLILFLTIAWFLTSCGVGTVEPPPSPTPGAEDGAREWIDAIVNQDGNRILKHTCKAQRENVKQSQMWISAFSVLAQLFTNPSVPIKGDISDLKFGTISQSSDQTEVRVFGELRVAVLGNAQAQQVDERWQMVRENDTWRWCGSNTGTLPLDPTSMPVQQKIEGRIAFWSNRGESKLPDLYVMNADSITPMHLAVTNFTAVWSPDGQQIAFVSDRDGNPEIYSMNADGSGQIRLTNNSANDRPPAWSPDGQQITFDSNRDGNFEIYVMNTDGSDQTRLTDDIADDVNPVWSPDGQQITFDSNRDGNLEIYVMNTDGTALTRLTDRPAADVFPTWSPDGQQIIFGNPGNKTEFYAVDIRSSELTHLTDYAGPPVYSPDNQQIVFTSRRDGNPEIYIMNTDGSGLTRLTNHPARDWLPVWSPDGQRIAFSSDRDGENEDEIYVMNIDGSGLTRLTNHPAQDLVQAWLSQ